MHVYIDAHRHRYMFLIVFARAHTHTYTPTHCQIHACMHARIQADWAWSISMNMRKQAGGHTKNSAELAGTGRKLSAELAGTGRTHPKTQQLTNLCCAWVLLRASMENSLSSSDPHCKTLL